MIGIAQRDAHVRLKQVVPAGDDPGGRGRKHHKESGAQCPARTRQQELPPWPALPNAAQHHAEDDEAQTMDDRGSRMANILAAIEEGGKRRRTGKALHGRDLRDQRERRLDHQADSHQRPDAMADADGDQHGRSQQEGGVELEDIRVRRVAQEQGAADEIGERQARRDAHRRAGQHIQCPALNGAGQQALDDLCLAPAGILACIDELQHATEEAEEDRRRDGEEEPERRNPGAFLNVRAHQRVPENHENDRDRPRKVYPQIPHASLHPGACSPAPSN